MWVLVVVWSWGGGVWGGKGEGGGGGGASCETSLARVFVHHRPSQRGQHATLSKEGMHRGRLCSHGNLLLSCLITYPHPLLTQPHFHFPSAMFASGIPSWWSN